MEDGDKAPDGADPAMEGTLGVADCVALRGATYEAALNGARRSQGDARQAGSKRSALQRGCRGEVGTPARCAASLRQEVSGSIGLGQSSRCERSQREVHEAMRGYAHPGLNAPGPRTLDWPRSSER